MEIEREKITILFKEVGVHYEVKGIAELDIHQSHDVHAFYRLIKNKSKVIHVQGYPGMSSEQEAHVYARLMDYDKMMESRTKGCSIGNEHAVIQQFPNFISGVEIPYDSRVLEQKLAENILELKQKTQKGKESSDGC